MRIMNRGALAVTSIIVAAGAMICGQQSPLPTTAAHSVTYAVASIKPDHLDGSSTRFSMDSNSLMTYGMTVKVLVRFAFNMNESQVSGGPAWVGTETYAIQAKLDDEAAETIKKLPEEQRQEQQRMLLQSLLAERFKLKVRFSTKEFPIYALVVAKNGPKFSHSADSPNEPSFSNNNGQATVKRATMSRFAEWLSRFVGRKVVNKTGLEGRYDLTFHWTQQKLGPAPVSAADSVPRTTSIVTDSGPSIFTALQKQLGLKLESQKGPVETLVIESVERPTEN